MYMREININYHNYASKHGANNCFEIVCVLIDLKNDKRIAASEVLKKNYEVFQKNKCTVVMCLPRDANLVFAACCSKTLTEVLKAINRTIIQQLDI